tara:strand:+ start:1467 stop:1823 length:357 start_codon:yes stop_codon:yes gene_type:complete
MSTNKEKYNKKYGFAKGTSHSKAAISRKTGISMAILDKVYDRGVGAHRNNRASVRNVKGVKGGPGKKMGPQQWAMARIYSFVMRQPGTWGKADKDLADRARGKKNIPKAKAKTKPKSK